MDRKALIALAERAESVGINLAKRAFRSPIEWNAEALAHSAHGFTVAASLRAIAEKGGE